jgi:hypothetical protein
MASPDSVVALAAWPRALVAPAQILNSPPISPDWEDVPNEKARLEVFLVTLAAILTETAEQAQQAGRPLRTLDGVTREMVLQAVLDAVQHPVVDHGRGGRPRTLPLTAMAAVVFLELPLHFHVAVKLSSQTRFLPLKQALRQRSAFASHWSTSHTMFFSTVRYGAFATARKPYVDLTPLQWTADGTVMNLYHESQEPFTATALKRRREQREQHPDPQDAGQNSRFTKLDFTAVVIAERLKTPNAVMEYVQGKGSAAMQKYVNLNQRKLKEFIVDAWEWHSAAENAAKERESDWALIRRLAAESCSCGAHCSWQDATAAFFRRNASTIDEEFLAACLAEIIVKGPSKKVRVPLICGPTNAGKSTVTDPIDAVFGPASVFHTPALGATMPLANLATKTKRFMYLDEFSPTEFASFPAQVPTVPSTTFLKLLSGQSLEVRVSGCFNDGNIDLRWDRGVAITCKIEDLWKPTANCSTGQISHMKARVHQFNAYEQIPETEHRTVPKCKESFSKWLVEKSTRFAMRVVPPSLPPLLPVSERSLVQSAPSARPWGDRRLAARVAPIDLD